MPNHHATTTQDTREQTWERFQAAVRYFREGQHDYVDRYIARIEKNCGLEIAVRTRECIRACANTWYASK